MVLLGVAVLFGGGGVGSGLSNLVVQLCAIAMLALNPRAVMEFVTLGPRVLVVLVLVSVALPLIQAIPLPPSVWHELPGRELVRDSLALVGREQSWFPLSVDSNRTLTAAISLLPCLAVLVLAQQVEDSRLHQLFWLVAWFGVVNLAFGVVQLATGNSHGNLYPGGVPKVLYGTFANRNSTALFLDIALIAVLWLPAASRDTFSRGLRIAIAVSLALGVLLTQSRSGAALLALIFAAWLASLILVNKQPSPLSGRSRWNLSLIAAALALLVVGGVVATSPKLDQTFERFESLDDERPEVWEDTVASAKRYWPVGSGIATFDEVFQVDESLEYLDPTRAGRAHNDYLELVLESGAFGIVLAIAWIAWIARRGWQVFQARTLLLQQGAFFVLLLIMLQSSIDYPLRNQALLCVAALVVSLLARSPKGADSREVEH